VLCQQHPACGGEMVSGCTDCALTLRCSMDARQLVQEEEILWRLQVALAARTHNDRLMAQSVATQISSLDALKQSSDAARELVRWVHRRKSAESPAARPLAWLIALEF